MICLKIPPVLKKMHGIFEQHGYSAYLVGGAVRDMLMGKTPSDWDVTTNARPEEIIQIFHKVIPTGIAHGTVTVHFMKNEIEVTTFRTESGYSDGRHPDHIEYAATIQDDLSRRDFTMNAIAVNLADGTVVDPFGGQNDIRHEIIRTVGKPSERFMEDGLRPIRAIRFAAQLKFSIEKDTYSELFKAEIQKKAAGISVERFRDEMIKLLKAEEPSAGIKLLEETHLLDIFMPEFRPCVQCIQGDGRGFHEFDVMTHLMYACDGAPKDKLNVRLAALLHDIGKPQAKNIKTENGAELYTFYNHEQISEKISRPLLARLKFPNALIDNVCHLVKNHMFNYEPTWTDAAVRRFLVRTGYENFEDLIDLRLADIYGMHRIPLRLHDSPAGKLLLELKDRIEVEHEKNSALTLKALAVNGKDLMHAGIPAGKTVGKVLNYLLETVLDDPAQNTKDTLLTIAQNYCQNMQKACFE